MTKSQQLDWLIKELSPTTDVPPVVEDKWSLFRSLVNVWKPKAIGNKFLTMQDDLLQSLIAERGVTDIADMHPVRDNIYLWRGNITALKVDAIVNAANSGMLGCFHPCHGCIDNAIHTFAGVQLRLECAAIMEKQGYPEPTGQAKITEAYNLPSRFVIHTVGPIVGWRLTQKDCEQLASSYRSCLNLALEHQLSSIAFCCISTGEFHFPQEKAAEIAVSTVEEMLEDSSSEIKVIFNVFKESDYAIYSRILSGN